jgi:hypothetical protein
MQPAATAPLLRSGSPRLWLAANETIRQESFASPRRFSQWFAGGLIVALPLLVLAGSTTHPARGYSIHGGWAQAYPGKPIELTYSYSNLLDGGLLDPLGEPVELETIRRSVVEAMEVWARVVPIHFVEVFDNGLSRHPQDGGTQGTIRLGHLRLDGPGSFKARAHFPGIFPISGDIHFDDTDRWSLAGTLLYPDILGAAIHELGHALGLGHSDIVEAAMYPTFPRTSGLGTGRLHADDVAGIQAIYGEGTGSVTPLVVPEPRAVLLLAAGLLGAPFLGERSRRGGLPPWCSTETTQRQR